MILTETQRELAERTVALLVDDLPGNLELLGNILSEAGFRIAVATNGAMALAVATAKPPDIILMDISMPEMDGITACRKLKESPSTAQIPIIFLTAHTEEEDIIRGFEAGGVDYVTKPFKPGELLSRILAHVELKQSRERILRQNEELARVNRRLAESEESLQELNTMKDKFFSLMAHDIRNPLSALHQIAEILVDPSFSLDDAQRKEMFEMLFRAANSLHDLLENILTWGRSQMGRLVVVQKIGAVAPQAEMVAALMAAAFRQKEVRLLQEIGEGVTAFFDANLLSALLRNLVSNALKFTPSGGTVRITAREAGDFVEIAVIDTGEGLKPDDVARLFRIDVDPHTIGSGKEKGTGLGLILCREFVEKQGGRIRVESELEKGSTFSFTVPRSGVDPAKEPPASSSPGRA